MSHIDRLDVLSARGGFLNLNIPVMPINLVYDTVEDGKIRIVEGLPEPVSMHFNKSGFMHMGFTSDMSYHMDWLSFDQETANPTATVPGLRDHWEADRADVEMFRVASDAKLYSV